MKLVGRPYLQRTLQGCIDEVSIFNSANNHVYESLQIFDVRRQCEIDSSRLTETDNRDVNMVSIRRILFSATIIMLLQANLLFFVEKILSAILASARSCPQMMCQVFSMLKDAAVAKFPGVL